jgi:hypothetical protein
MGRMTVLSAENMTLGTGNVLAGFRPAAADAAASIVRVTRVEISQSGATTLAMIRGAIGERDTAGTLTVTSTAPNPLTLGAPASGLTGATTFLATAARSGTNSSADSGGTYTNTVPFNFANTSGYLWKPDPKEIITVTPGRVFVVRLLATPGTATGWSVAVFLDEGPD